MLFLLSSHCGALQAELNFQYVELDDGYFAYERDVGDVDGDGDNDIVAVEEGDTSLQVFRAPSWSRSVLVSFAGTNKYPRADDLKLGDIDGDGDLDIITRLGVGPSDDGAGIAVWCENLGAGTNFAPRLIGNSLEYVKDIVVVDLDRDGRLDVAMRMNGQTQVWLQETNGTWTEVLLSHASHEGMEAGDVDMDGDPDLVLNGFWFATPNTPAAARIEANYTKRVIDSAWFSQDGEGTDNSCKVVVGDFDGDGTNDVAFSQSEAPGYAVTWYRSATPNAVGPWIGTPVTTVDYCHNLQAADFDLDGAVDLLVGGMEKSQHRGLKLMLNQGAGTNWSSFVIQTNGSYSAEVGDIDADGDLDIVGIQNYDSAPSWFYRNNAGGTPSLDFWFYKQVTDQHVRTFSLCFPDVDGDGDLDIASGPFVYVNPGGSMTNVWTQVPLPDGVHAFATLDVDSDDRADLIAQKDNPGQSRIDLYWVEAANAAGTAWAAPIYIGEVPRGSEPEGFQGYKVGQIVAGGRPEIVVNAPQNLYCFEVPQTNPAAGNWSQTLVTLNSSEEGIGLSDMDCDGHLDIAFSAADPNQVLWARNPGNGSSNWAVFVIGEFPEATYPDRCEVADFNGDGLPDIAVTEENFSGLPDALAYWWEQPATGATNTGWARHLIATQFTMNSMDVGDVDQDGHSDIVLAEHAGSKRIGVWANDGAGQFAAHAVDQGRESHLGGRLVDLDQDGDLDLVSIAYTAPSELHIWRNDSPPLPPLSITNVVAPNANLLRVVFSQPVDLISAQTSSNYFINNGIEILDAVLQTNTVTVDLSISNLRGGVPYVLTINNVSSRIRHDHLIPPDTQVAFQYAGQPPNVIVPGPQITAEDVPLMVSLQVSDVEAPDGVSLRIVAMDTDLVPDANISISGSATNPVVTLLPATNQFGATTIFVLAEDPDGFASSAWFSLLVLAVNDAPVLESLADIPAYHGQLLWLTNQAKDVDSPPSHLTYQLIQSPAGAQISTNGVISWLAQFPPVTNVFSTVVTDDGNPHLSATNSFRVLVVEADFRIVALLLSNQAATVTWSSVPGRHYQLQYSDGFQVAAWNAVPGIVTATNSLTTHDHVAVAGGQRYYRVIEVADANSPPVLDPPPDLTVLEGQTLWMTNQAYDWDVPPNQLSYQLIEAPLGATLTTSGVIHWVAGPGAGTNWFRIAAADDGTPSLSATNLFKVVVLQLPLTQPPVIHSVTVSLQSVCISWSSILGVNFRLQYKDTFTDTEWVDQGQVLAGNGTILMATNWVGSLPQRFYRLVSLN